MRNCGSILPSSMRTARARRLAGRAAAALCAATLFAADAHAQDAADPEVLKQQCLDPGGSEVLAACSALIDSGDFSGAELAAFLAARGDYWWGQENWAYAASSYEAAVEADPERLDAWRRLARADLAGGADDHALGTLNAALELAPDDPELSGLRGSTLANRIMADANDLILAMLDLNTALEADPENPALLIDLGLASAAHGAYPAAAEVLERALDLPLDGEPVTGYPAFKRRPLAFEAEHLYGLALLGQGQFDAAAAAFERAQVLVPAAVEPALGLFQTHCARGDLAAATAFVEAAMEDNIPTIMWQTFMIEQGIIDYGTPDIRADDGGPGPGFGSALGRWMDEGCPMFFPHGLVAR